MKNLSLVLALALAGCSVKVDPFVQSDAAMMAKVVNDVVFDKNLAAALKKASGKKPTRKKTTRKKKTTGKKAAGKKVVKNKTARKRR